VLKNFSLSSGHDVRTLCEDFFRQTGVNCFSYSRVYSDGSRAELWSDALALQHTFIIRKYIVGAYTPAYYSSGDRYALLENRIYSFRLPDRDRYAAQIIDQREMFDHAYPFKIINKTDEFCEYFIYYSPASQRNMVEFYINNLDILDEFSQYFKDAGANLIQKASEDRIIKPVIEDAGTDPRCLKEFKPTNATGQRLTQRQLEIARHLVTGRTARDIAHELGISPRTVESHTENLKLQLRCSNKAKLVIQLARLDVASKR
jgi:LuxR family quorum-sensing system transcriptional regulator SolR